MDETRRDLLPEALESASRKPRTSILRVYLITCAGAIAWLAGIFLAPYLKSRSSSWGALVCAVYAPTCHQAASRSFYCFGYPVAVCARCLGIYLGFLAGLGFYPLSRGFRQIRLPPARLFLSVSAPIVLDTLGNFSGLWLTSGWLRLATGVLWGSILPFYFITGVAELVLAGKYRLKLPPHSS